MGFHLCTCCAPGAEKNNSYRNTSSGDVNLIFESGNTWVMPDMILHYVADHRWQPPQEFVQDVMHGRLAESGYRLTRSAKPAPEPTKVGYLVYPIKEGTVPRAFVDRLELLMNQAGSYGGRVQTKGAIMRGADA